jgi:uncharacterized protein YehS (DUF1456 family)
MKTVYYSDKFTSANTIYADIDTNTKTMMLDDIVTGFYSLLERANYDETVSDALKIQDKIFRKHQTSKDPKLNNSLQSFLAGLLKQHYNKPDKDISTKMLEGLHTASLVLNKLKVSEAYKFEKISSGRTKNTPFDKLFH